MSTLKIDKHMLVMYHMDGALAEHLYNTDHSHFTRQKQNTREFQTHLTSSPTIFSCPKTPQKMQQQLQHHN